MKRNPTCIALSVTIAASAAWLPRDAEAAPTPTPDLDSIAQVRGSEVTQVDLRAAAGDWRSTPWDDLERTTLEPGVYEVRVSLATAHEGDALWLPACAGRRRITVGGREVASPPGPVLVPLPAEPQRATVTFAVSGYERRIACGARPAIGTPVVARDGLGVLSFSSPYARRGGGHAVVYVPPGHEARVAAPVLVGAHPWNGSIWTYAAYASLLKAARAHDVVLLMPSALGNSLYTADAEDEVMRAIDALASVVAVDPRGVSIWGASMGGAGATTIAFHRPDRFASVTSFFGDSKYDLSTYVRALLPNEAAAHLVDALDVVDNARHLPLWLLHGTDDRTTPISQSEILDRAMRARGFAVRFDRIPATGHSGALVAQYAPDVVSLAAASRVPSSPSRVTYRSVRPSDVGAFGVRIERTEPRGDAFVDVARTADGVHVQSAVGVRAIVLARGALGTAPAAPPAIVDDTHSVDVRWEASP